MSSDDPRPLADELGLRGTAQDDPRTPTGPDSPGDAGHPQPAGAPGPANDGMTHLGSRRLPEAPAYRRGPAPFGLFLGIVGLVVAFAVFLTEVTDVAVPWSDLGPWVVVGGGLLVVLVGVLGLRANRAQD